MPDELREEKRLIAEGKPESGTLMSNLVRSSESLPQVVQDEKERDVKDGKESLMKPLSVDELLGNTYVFNFAGHDRTAISLAFSVLLLVAHPETQDWILKELNCFLDTSQKEDWRYETV